jgi:hypothetical protein
MSVNRFDSSLYNGLYERLPGTKVIIQGCQVYGCS